MFQPVQAEELLSDTEPTDVEEEVEEEVTLTKPDLWEEEKSRSRRPCTKTSDLRDSKNERRRRRDSTNQKPRGKRNRDMDQKRSRKSTRKRCLTEDRSGPGVGGRRRKTTEGRW